MKILIVDDSRAMQTIVRRGIEQLGYDDMDIRNADDGNQALDIIRKWEPNLVLSDWHMPEMTGIELLQSLNRQMLDTQIGFVTTETSDKRKQEALAAGAKFFVQKPFDYKTLHEAVLPLLQGNAEAEKALVDEEPEPEEKNHVKLPDLATFETILTHFSKSELLIDATDHLELKEYNFPCLLGLFEDSDSKMVCAVAILDLQATCIIGACVTSIPEDRVREAIEAKAVPKAMLANCNKVMEAISIALYNEQTMKHLKLRSINIMRKDVTSIQKLLKKPSEERIDLEVAVQGYGSGNFSIVAS